MSDDTAKALQAALFTSRSTEPEAPEQPLHTPAAGYVASEGRLVGRPKPSPSSVFAEFINQQLGYTR